MKVPKSQVFRLLQAGAVLLLSFETRTLPAEIEITGELWRDDGGNPIYAHEHDISRFNGIFYLYGSNYENNPEGWVGVEAPVKNGINVYSSENLRDWHYEGVALEVMGWAGAYTYHRPHIIYNDQTQTYVMWLYVYSGYPNQAAVAVADDPAGPFTLLDEPRTTTSPNNGSCADMNVFKDDDGKAYLIFDQGDFQIRIDELTGDYLSVSGTTASVVMAAPAEAPAMVKFHDRYLIVCSGTRGWGVSPTNYAVAENPLGPYTEKRLLGDVEFEEREENWMFRHQSTDLVYIEEADRVMFCGDGWWKAGGWSCMPPVPNDLNASHHVWLPVVFTFNPDDPWLINEARLEYPDRWDPLFSESRADHFRSENTKSLFNPSITVKGSSIDILAPGAEKITGVTVLNSTGRTLYSRCGLSENHLSVPAAKWGHNSVVVHVRGINFSCSSRLALLHNFPIQSRKQ